MRRLLGTVPALALATLLLAGCGEGDAPTASDPAPTDPTGSTDSTGSSETATDLPTTGEPGDPGNPSDQPTKSPPLTPGGVPFELIEIVSGTAAGDAIYERPVELRSGADVDSYVAGFSDQLAEDIETSFAANPVQDGQSLYVAVVGSGCDVPPGVEVAPAPGGGYAITGTKVPDPLTECFAPVTSVALVAISD